MNKETVDNLRNSLESAFIDATIDSNLALKPRLLTNNHQEGQKLLSVLEEELLNCNEFSISVAFITLSGLTPLLQTLKELERKGVRGRILTTDYLTFSEPEALEKLSNLHNIELRMYEVGEGPGFHTKGYIFRSNEFYKIIIGSSNMTLRALTVNHEWNTKIVSTEQGEIAQETVKEFECLWWSENTRSYSEFYEEYKTKYETIKRQQKTALQSQVVSIDAYKLKPNKMQVAFTKNLKELVNSGAKRAILISSTGTGKTYASAFGIRDAVSPKGKIMFIVHRNEILRQACSSYKKVFGSKYKTAFLTGNDKDYDAIQDADIVFAMITMISKDDVMTRFGRDEFSVICLDEAHRTGANSYQKIMEYFAPNLWLGMTASPERMDGFNVFELFDNNIAYEIRLQQAMEEDMLCPFHYFGITDLEINGEIMDEQTGIRNFRYLVCDERVDYILKQAKYYGYSGDRVKGLIFCSRAKEAEELSSKFNERGLRTVFLSGESSSEKREEMMELLTTDNTENYLDYIFTVDIFNEGVDLPEVNQVIMLRPTQSPVVFVQQLGRGLRKAENKEFVVVLDFIGNYQNNFMIPIALSGDRSYNKDNVRRYVMEGTRVIPGCSTIHFDEISRKRIFAAIDSANFNDVRLIKENYRNLKYKLGRIPKLMDFDEYGEMDVLRIFDNNSLGSYYKFLVKYEPDYQIRLSKEQEKAIEFISKKIANGKRIHEIELLKKLLLYKKHVMTHLKESLHVDYNIELSKNTYDSIVNVMTNEFPSGTGKATYLNCVFLEKEGEDYSISKPFERMLEKQELCDMVSELIEFGQYRYNRDYSARYQDTDFVLYQKYTYEDVCRLLGWEHNEVPLNIGGYKYDKKTKTFPVFINYDKSDDIQDTVKYEDHFISVDRLIAISKSNRSVDSEDVQNFVKAKERGIDVELFVRKNKDDKISKEFYYLGRMTASGRTREFIMPNTTSSAVEIEWILDTPVRSDIYEYIVEK